MAFCSGPMLRAWLAKQGKGHANNGAKSGGRTVCGLSTSVMSRTCDGAHKQQDDEHARHDPGALRAQPMGPGSAAFRRRVTTGVKL